ncbi:MAG TPA: glycosyltransferase family 4 protein [Polyangiaceae bacterium]|jgi:glycosyltransferase involved in cell wall biosynthesis|nr:glycosyltransferase family 4 protein [Polyangiaceae bacterium]
MSDLRKIAFIGNYLPRKCGIATFTGDLRNAVQSALPTSNCPVIAVSDRAEGYDYPEDVRFEIAERDGDDYVRAAEYLNFLNVDVVCVQHEFGIYGGASGSHLLSLLRRLRMPIVTCLHTILKQPSPEQRRVMQELGSLSSRVVCMSECGRAILKDVYSLPERKIDLIAHGIPDMPFTDPNFFKDQYSVEGRRVLLTFGLLSPNKGIEKVIEALPEIVAEFPDVVYIVLGATHPNLVRDHGEVYRDSLKALADRLGVSEHVRFFDQFVELEELKRFLGAADIYVTPYLNPAQITSGTLAYAFGCGKAVVSTPYWHAEELLADGRGVFVPFGDSAAIAREVSGLLRDESRRHAMRKRAYMLGREMVWSKVAERYLASFEAARKSRSERQLKVVPRRTADSRELSLPELGFEHLKRMSDSTGMLQHARFTFPNYAEGYCIDDNARALMLTVEFETRGVGGGEIAALATRYASFLDYAYNAEHDRFRNFMSYDRRWLEECGSEDSQARAIWALGTCVGRTQRRELRVWAADLFLRALPAIVDTSSPRAWSFALLGMREYLRRLRGDRAVARMQLELLNRLLAFYEQTKQPGWHWFEEIVAYDNARIAQAVLATAGKKPELEGARTIGLEALRWLVAVQRAERGHFRPIGSNGFYRRGEPRARFDQQPLEAHATVSACSEAFRITGDRFWLVEARRAFGWFLGQNDLDASIYNPDSGGCRDGLHVDRVNLNEGAESTLAFLTALVEIQALEAQAGGTEEVPKSGERELELAPLLSAANQSQT